MVAESRGQEDREVMEKAAERAEKVLADEAIDIEDFVDLYGADAVSADREYVADYEARFRRNDLASGNSAEGAAKVVEAVIGDGIGLHDWMGGTANFIVPARFDDIKNGIDGLVEFSEDGRSSHLGLAIDATFSGDVAKKLGGIEHKIQGGHSMGMKYFQSEAMGFRGELKGIPQVVAAFDRRTVQSLADLWIHKDKDGLAKHPAQFQLLEELIAQCQKFEKFASANQSNMKARYEHAEAILRQVMRDRAEQVEDTGERDARFYELMGQLG